MSQSLGTAVSAQIADLLSKDTMDVQGQKDVSLADHSEDMLLFPMSSAKALSRGTFDHMSHNDKMAMFIKDGYYGYKKERLLGKDDGARIRAVAKVADRYISPEGWDVVHGADQGDEPGSGDKMEWGNLC